jgi:hypothetical protein
LFSLSALLEHTFTDIYPRQLSGGHTHLFTAQSLAKLSEQFGLEAVGEWWFGTDVVDLFRSVIVRGGGNAAYANVAEQLLGSHVDALQAALDQARVCSEVHMVLRKT